MVAFNLTPSSSSAVDDSRSRADSLVDSSFVEELEGLRDMGCERGDPLEPRIVGGLPRGTRRRGDCDRRGVDGVLELDGAVAGLLVGDTGPLVLLALPIMFSDFWRFSIHI